MYVYVCVFVYYIYVYKIKYILYSLSLTPYLSIDTDIDSMLHKVVFNWSF